MRTILPLAALLALSFAPISAHADEWCGFHDKAGSQVKCGFSSLSECQQAVGGDKNAVCMPDPTFADNKAGRHDTALAALRDHAPARRPI